MASPSSLRDFPSISADLSAPAARNWRAGLPRLDGSVVSLRELRITDAPALLSAIVSAEVTRFVSPPPPNVEGFEKFIAWTHRQREAGQSLAFGIVPEGTGSVIGLFQVRALKPAFDVAEWGFAIGSEHWGRGVFADGAQLVLDFAFDVLGVHRVEARAAIKNGRGNGALAKLGAQQEGVLHRSFLRNGAYLDQALWAIIAENWRAARVAPRMRVVH